MIVYRIQIFQGEVNAFVNDWQPTEAVAMKALHEASRCGWEARVDQIETPAGREAMCEFLRLVDSSHVNLEGTPIARICRGEVTRYKKPSATK